MLRLAFVSEQSRLKNALKKYKTDLELEQSAGERKDITINQHKQKVHFLFKPFMPGSLLDKCCMDLWYL